MSKSTITASESLQHEFETASCQTRQFSAISTHSTVTGTPQDIRDWLTSLQPDSPVSLSALPENDAAQMTTETVGPPLLNAFAWYSPDTCSWRTYQACLIPDISEPSSVTWPKAGMTAGGVCYRLPKWERRIAEIDCGLFATPNAADSRESTGGGQGRSLRTDVRVWPTPAARDYRSPNVNGNMADQLPNVVGGQLNPTWTEWLMGWPLEWTDLKPLETAKFRQWLRRHGYC